MGKKLISALFLAILGGLVFPLPTMAQGSFLTGRGQAVRPRPHVPLRGARPGAYLTGRRGHRYPRHTGTGPLPYLYPPYYYGSDYYSQPAPATVQPSRVVVVEKSQPRVETPPPPPPESLVLELRGNHWVRLTDSGQTVADLKPAEKGSSRTASLRTMTPEQSAVIQAPRKLPPAVLVFRDGHREEITRYTIVGGTIYTCADYWNNGSWTKKVPIAELDVPATLQLNSERGARFSLPSGPSVVVVRP